MKCAIVQFEAVHEEIIPSLITAFAAAGISSEVFINQNAAAQRGDVFSAIGMTMPSSTMCRSRSAPTGRRWRSASVRADFDIICMATCQRESVANWALKFDLPLIGVAHNVDMFRNVDVLMNMFKRGRLSLLTLGAHVASFACRHMPARRMDAIGVMQPVYWGDAPERDAPLPSDGTRRLAVPGGVKFETRDYLPLLDAVKELFFINGRAGIRIDVVGGGSDRAELMARADEAGLREHFHFAPLMDTKRVGYDDYVAHLRNAHFLLPLNPPRFTPSTTRHLRRATTTTHLRRAAQRGIARRSSTAGRISPIALRASLPMCRRSAHWSARSPAMRTSTVPWRNSSRRIARRRSPPMRMKSAACCGEAKQHGQHSDHPDQDLRRAQYGTNYLERVLRLNFVHKQLPGSQPLKTEDLEELTSIVPRPSRRLAWEMALDVSMADIRDSGFGWKHGVPPWDVLEARPKRRESTLFILLSKHPADWVRSMHRKPYHCMFPHQNMEQGAFMRHPWICMSKDGLNLQPHLVAMWNAKYRAWLDLRQCGGTGGLSALQ